MSNLFGKASGLWKGGSEEQRHRKSHRSRNKLQKVSYKQKIFELWNSISREHKYLIAILLLSFVLRVVYVFHCTDYKNYLLTDMGVYWDRAHRTFNGDIFNTFNWTAWATCFHFYLTFIFKVLFFFGFIKYRLEAVIILNIIFSTLSVFFTYLIARLLIKKSDFRLLATFLYAVSCPIIYYNALVLSENVSIPLLIISVYLLLGFHEKYSTMFLSGLILALAVGIRPSLGLIFIPCLFYGMYAKKMSFNSTLRSITFSFGFLLVIFLIVVENNYISDGELKNLAGYGGAHFYFQHCRTKSIHSIYKELHTKLAPPVFLADPKFGKIKELRTDHPIHDQKYFYKEAFKCIKENPNVFIENFFSLKHLLIDNYFPSFRGVKGFGIFKKLSAYLVLFMTSTLGFFYFIRNDREIITKEVLLLLSIPLCLAITAYFYLPEFRYFVPAYFAIYILFFTILSNLKKYKKQLENYFKALVIIFILWFLYNKIV